jgi:hypothetical protein
MLFAALRYGKYCVSRWTHAGTPIHTHAGTQTRTHTTMHERTHASNHWVPYGRNAGKI